MKKRNIYMNLPAAAAAMLSVACGGNFDDALSPSARPGNATGTYGVSIGADCEGEYTRAEYDGVDYKWSPGDRVGFYMVPAGGSTPIVSNARFTGANASPAVKTDFEGELSEASLSQVSPSQAYDYYSYFPYNQNAGSAGFPNVTFAIPNEITLRPDVFPVEYGFMVGGKESSSAAEKPVSWLENGEQKLGKHIGFRYRHVFAYLQVYLKLNLMTQDIDRIVVTCTDGSAMSGAVRVNLATGEVSFTAASDKITVHIDGGLNVDENPDKGYIWIPMNPALAGKTFKLEFYTTGGHMIDQTITGGALQAGMKHKAGFIFPFKINFAGVESQAVAAGGNNFSFKGYTFGGNGKPRRNGDRVSFYAASNRDQWYNINSGGDIEKNNADRAALRLPPLNVKNTLGLSSIPVQIQMIGNTEGVNDGTKPLGGYATYGRYYFTAVDSGFSSHLEIPSAEGSVYQYIIGVQSAVNYNAQEYSDSKTRYAYLTTANPCVLMHYVGNFIGATIKNEGHIYELRIVPVL